MINNLHGKRILSVLAHPDDEAFGMGGTLALYAMRGAEVYLACATLGEAGDIPPDFLQNHSSSGALRESELDCSADALALKQVFKLGFRDSGMAGSPDNQHPDALVARPMEEVVERIADVMRQVRRKSCLLSTPWEDTTHRITFAFTRRQCSLLTASARNSARLTRRLSPVFIITPCQNRAPNLQFSGCASREKILGRLVAMGISTCSKSLRCRFRCMSKSIIARS